MAETEQTPMETSKPETTETPKPEGIDITPNQDGGVYKLIKREGTGEDRPQTGNSVFVHYVGTLTNGEKFDSSRDRDDQFSFKLGTGNVIKAWDIGVATMRRGELAVLTCTAPYAYGENGSPPKIPPNATLIFEVELFDWHGEDLSKAKDQGIIRTQIQAGEGFDTPNDGATVEVHITGFNNGKQFEDRDVTFVVGESFEADICPGIDTAIVKFKKGEKSKLKIASQYAYGSVGSSALNIAPNTDLEYEVTLKSFEMAKEAYLLNGGEKLEQADIAKTKGTNYFKAQKYALALKYYKKICDFLESEDSMEGEEADKRKTLLLASYLNTAMCYLKLDGDLEAVEACDKAIDLDNGNEKAYFRRGTAQMNMQDYDEALKSFNQVLEISPDNKAAKNQMTITKQKIKAYNERERNKYKNMFSKFAAEDAKKEASSRLKQQAWNVDVDDWDNKMAAGLLPIEREAEAFGDKVAEPKYNKEQKDAAKENEAPDDNNEDFD